MISPPPMVAPPSTATPTIDDPRRGFANGAAAALERLKTADTFASDVASILDRRIQPASTVDSYGELGSALAEYAGEDITTFVLWALTVDDFEAAFADLKPELARHKLRPGRSTSALVGWIALLRALYATPVQDAQLKWRQEPDDWMFIQREAFKDYLRDAWVIRFSLTKFNGEKFTVVGSPNTAINLISQLFTLITAFPDLSAFGEAEVDAMSTAIGNFSTKFYPEAPAASPTEATAPVAEAGKK